MARLIKSKPKQITVLAELWDFHPLFKLMNEMYDSIFVSMYAPRYQEHTGAFSVIEWKEKLLSPLFWPYKLFARTVKLLRLIREQKPDMVVSHHDDANVSVLPALLLLRVLGMKRPRFVLWVRNNPVGAHGHTLAGRITLFCYKHLYRYADTIVVQVATNKQVLAKHFPSLKKKIVVIPNIYDVQLIKKHAQEPLRAQEKKFFANSFVFSNLGRMTDQKGQWFLLRAFSVVAQKHPNARLLLIGDGPYAAQLRTLATELGIAEKMLFINKTPNPFKYYKASNCFVFPSLYEGFPNSISEALTLNVPVVAADCLTGPRDILCPELVAKEPKTYPYYGKFGILLRPFPAGPFFESVAAKPLLRQEKELAATMERMLVEKSLQKKYSTGSERMKEFDAKQPAVQALIHEQLQV